MRSAAADRSIGRSFGRSFARSVGRSDGRPIGRSVGRSVGRQGLWRVEKLIIHLVAIFGRPAMMSLLNQKTECDRQRMISKSVGRPVD